MKVRPEVSSVNDYLPVGTEGNKIPIVKTSEAETSVRIKDGVTIVIGGLIEESNSDIREKVPFLGDIPVLGAFFRNRNTSKGKTEIAIFLTPRIISGEESLTPDLSPFKDSNSK
jgi:type II secretory pathway component GspD/PulD (secretin)